MYCHQINIGGKYDLIKSYIDKLYIYQNDRISLKNILQSSPPTIDFEKIKENNKNDIAAW